MPAWKSVVRLYDIHKARRDGSMTINEVAKELSRRLRETEFGSDPDLQDLCEELELTDDNDEYDWVLEAVYEYADDGHRIWLDPFDPPQKAT